MEDLNKTIFLARDALTLRPIGTPGSVALFEQPCTFHLLSVQAVRGNGGPQRGHCSRPRLSRFAHWH